MKKILIASTALVAFGVASAAQASSPIKLELGGSAQWVFGVSTQSKEFKRDKDYSSTDVKGNNYLNFNGSTILDNGMKVGFVSILRAGGNSRTDHNADPIDRSYAYVEGRMGKLMIGTVDQAPKQLHVSAPDAAGLSEDAGLGIVSGRWVGMPSDFYTLDGTLINTGDGAEKLTYFTPKFAGFTLGASFAPGGGSSDFQDTGNRNLGTGNETYSLGLGYDNTFSGGVALKASLGWQFSNQFNADLVTGKGGFGNAAVGGAAGGSAYLDKNGNVAHYGRTDTYNDYSGGIRVSFDGFTFGGGLRYRDIDRTGAWREVDQLAWAIGAQYAFDKKVVPLTVSLNYYDVESKLKDYDRSTSDRKDRLHNVNLSGNYELGAGVNWISTIGWIKYDSGRSEVGVNNDTFDNDGMAFITGLKLAF